MTFVDYSLHNPPPHTHTHTHTHLHTYTHTHTHTFHWTAIPLRSWRSWIFSKIITNRRGSVDSHTIWGVTLPVRFHYAAATLLLRSHCDNKDLSLVYADGDVAATLLRPWRWSYAFVALLYPFYIESEIPIRFYYDLGASTALLLRSCRFCYDSCLFDQDFEL